MPSAAARARYDEPLPCARASALRTRAYVGQEQDAEREHDGRAGERGHLEPHGESSRGSQGTESVRRRT